MEISQDKLDIDLTIAEFFNIFDNRNNRQPDWAIIKRTCIAEIVLTKKTGITQTIYNLASFIEPRKSILTDGTLRDFQEKELTEVTTISGHIAQRYSTYQKSGYLKDTAFTETGIKLFQLIKTIDGWKINALVWEDD